MSGDDEDYVRFHYESSANVSFKGVIESGLTRAEWVALSEDEQNAAVEEALFDLVQIYVEGDS